MASISRSSCFLSCSCLISTLFISDDLSGSGLIVGIALGRWALSRCFICFIIEEHRCRYEAGSGTVPPEVGKTQALIAQSDAQL